MKRVLPIFEPPTREEFFKALESLSAEELEMINFAYIVSQAVHAHQPRESGDPYFTHPFSVAWILVKEFEVLEWEIIVDAFLHDTQEVTDGNFRLSLDRLKRNFGLSVADDVEALTYFRETEPLIHGYLERLTTRGWRVLLVKLADRLHNMRTLRHCLRKKQVRKTRETIEHFIPLCDTLESLLPRADVWQARYLKRELQKECARYA